MSLHPQQIVYLLSGWSSDRQSWSTIGAWSAGSGSYLSVDAATCNMAATRRAQPLGAGCACMVALVVAVVLQGKSK